MILTPAEIEVILKSLPIGKAAGPDCISNQILSELATEHSYPLCSLFNQPLQIGTLPDFWKLSNVCPIPKTSDYSSVSNVRPVSLLCTPEKVFERAIFKHVLYHFRDNSILTSLQSGFILGDSTVIQLTCVYNAFSQALDFGKEVRVVFCDISKAFDHVWHEDILKSLKLLVYLEIFFYGSSFIYLIYVRVSFSLMQSQHGNVYELVFLRVLFLVLFFFFFLFTTL